jgi:hypothetical protein
LEESLLNIGDKGKSNFNFINVLVSASPNEDHSSSMTNEEYNAFCTLYEKSMKSKFYNRLYHWKDKKEE